MAIIRAGLIILTSFFIASCGMLKSPFEGVNDDKVDQMTLATTIKTKDLYGAWAIASDDETNPSDIEFLYVVVLMPNHVGVNYLSMDEKKGRPESVYTESYTWQFNEKTNVFTMNSYERVSEEDGKPEKKERLNTVTEYKTELYLLDGKSLAIRFDGSDGKFSFLRMENDVYYKLVKSVPGLPRIK